MRRGATREDIIRTTQSLIVRNGIRAVRVDEIAQTLGISKRTLYEAFVDKTALIGTCLDNMISQQTCKVSNYMEHRSDCSLRKVLWLINHYIDSLQNADDNFLSELEQIYADYFEQDKLFWEQSLSRELFAGRKDGYILLDTNCDKIAQYLLVAVYKLRLANTSVQEQKILCRTILRGIATRNGIDWIDTRQL